MSPKRKQLVVCPKCGSEFDISYSRAFACGTCPQLIHCSMVKCPRCGHEFPSPYSTPLYTQQF
ncbi:MAG: hypothetical protein ACE5Z5_14565 [Candidatus Bathyarchaeia archaeon]